MTLDQKLEQPEISLTNPELAELQRKALEMAKYYYKGFGTTIEGILNNGEEYLQHPERAELADKSYGWFKKIEEFYANIPFDNLQGKEEFYPLFIIRRLLKESTSELLPKFKENMDAVFKDRNKSELRNLETDTRSIVNVGRLYFETLMQTLQEIRVYPEAKDFRVAISDRNKNYIWSF